MKHTPLTPLWEGETILSSESSLSVELSPTTSKFYDDDLMTLSPATVVATDQRIIIEGVKQGASFSFYLMFYNCVSVGVSQGSLIITATNAIDNELNGYYETEFLDHRMNFEPFILNFNEKELAVDMNCRVTKTGEGDLKELYAKINQMLAETSDPEEIAGDLDAGFLDSEFYTKDNIDEYLSKHDTD